MSQEPLSSTAVELKPSSPDADGADWRFEYEVVESMPRLAWLAAVSSSVIRVWTGGGVRLEQSGFFEGTWSGQSGPYGAATSTTVFGSGIVRVEDELVVLTPAHTLEPVYHCRAANSVRIVSNSLVALLEATGAALLDDAPYPRLFGSINRGLTHATIDLPVTKLADGKVTVQYFENLAITPDGAVRVSPKRRDDMPLRSFNDYRDQLVAHVASAFANGAPFEPLATISSGYDSTASAAVGAQAGCHRAVTFRSGWPWRGYRGTQDSGEKAARALGMSVDFYERLAYLELDDAPEAEFLATGMSGEDVVYRSMESALPGAIVLTGFWGGAAWRGHDRQLLSRLDLSGASLGEFRLRTGFIHLPVPYVCGLQQPTIARLRTSPEMQPFSVGGRYDEPFARRLAEEGGVPRGAFGVQKLAASQKLHSAGVAVMSPSGRASFEEFAGVERLGSLPRRRPITRLDRMALRVGEGTRLNNLVSGISDRRREAVHMEPVLGSLMFRWAVEQIRPRYSALRSVIPR